MTTVAVRKGILAGDSRICAGDTIITNNALKVRKLRDGRLFGYAGNVEEGQRLYEAVKKKELIKLNDVQALVVEVDGKVYYFEGRAWVFYPDQYTAIGTGADFAIAAMDQGATAVEAVRAACKRDSGSGGRVRSVRLKKRR